MCRHAAYVGPGATLTEMMWDLQHSLQHQAYQSRELLTGVVCADGFGVGWYDTEVQPEPARYANPFPIWSDTILPSVGPVTRTRMMIGAVRNATIAGSNHQGNCAPFASGRYLFSHNGYLTGFDHEWKETMLHDWVSPERRALIRGSTDSEHIFQAILTEADTLQEQEVERNTVLVQATKTILQRAIAYADENEMNAQLNLLLSDGDRLIATRSATQPMQNSLYILQDGDAFPDGTVVASEPLYDDPLWEPLDPDTITVVQDGAPPVRMNV